MVYSESKKFIFIHIPKTAGKSLTDALAPYASNRVDYDNFWVKLILKRIRFVKFLNMVDRHARLTDVQDYLSPEEFDRCLKFTFIRNPYDRLVSQFLFQQQYKEGNRHEMVKDWSFRDYVLWMEPWMHTVSMSNFMKDHSGKVNMDFVGRLENFEADAKELFGRLGIAYSVPHINKTVKEKSYHSYYDDELKSIVAKGFAEDFDRFGYTF